jgi:hypothetical protein
MACSRCVWCSLDAPADRRFQSSTDNDADVRSALPHKTPTMDNCRTAEPPALLGDQTRSSLPSWRLTLANLVLVGPELAQGSEHVTGRPGTTCRLGPCSPQERSRPGSCRPGRCGRRAGRRPHRPGPEATQDAGAGAGSGAGRQHRRAGTNHPSGDSKGRCRGLPVQHAGHLEQGDREDPECDQPGPELHLVADQPTVIECLLLFGGHVSSSLTCRALFRRPSTRSMTSQAVAGGVGVTDPECCPTPAPAWPACRPR